MKLSGNIWLLCSLALWMSVTVLSSCNDKDNSNFDVNQREDVDLGEGESTLWVNSYKVVCGTEENPRMCMTVREGSGENAKEWTVFENNILGFDWEPGYVFHLVVRKSELPKEQVPRNAPGTRYALIRVLDQSEDPATKLQNIWILQSIGDDEIGSDQNAPTLGIRLSMQSVSGKDGCNQYSGKILELDSENIRISPLVSTEMACPDMSVPDRFQKDMQKVEKYSLEGDVLDLQDRNKQVLLTFRKG